MNEPKFSHLPHAALGHCLLILLAAALLGEVVSADDPFISAGMAGLLVGWVTGVGGAHILLVGVLGRGRGRG